MASPDMPALRLDRWMTLRVIAPLSGVLPSHRAPAIPILMYHSIAGDVDDQVHPYFRTVTTPVSFARQVKFMRQQGFVGVTLSEALDSLRSPGSECDGRHRKVVLTFDDGFRDFHTHAFPILERAGFSATVFLSTAHIGKPFITGRDCLKAGEVKALSQRGIEFGSHSVSHRRLVDLPLAELAIELNQSKATIEHITGKEVSLFSYPYRFPQENVAFTRSLGGLLDAAGYQAGVTTTIGRSHSSDDARFLPRLPMNDCDDADLLRAKLDGHYDWLRAGQMVRKQSRAWMNRWRPS